MFRFPAPPRPRRLPVAIRGSTLAAWLLGLSGLALSLLMLDARRLGCEHDAARSAGRRALSVLQLGDPALFTEARYARHASQSDRHAAFQDHPLALEHFPAGSLMPPPEHARLD